MFWHVDDALYNADDQLRDNAQAVKSKITAATPPEDAQLLEDAVHHLWDCKRVRQSDQLTI
jgi:hypothetical protein